MAVEFYRFFVALGIGILIGVQREYAYDDPDLKLFAGVRTFALIALVGYGAALASAQLESALPFLGVTLVFGAWISLAYYYNASSGKPGLTTETAALLTFITGAMSYWDLIPLAAALAVVMMGLLSLKRELRGLAHMITRADIYATLAFAVISLIVLPVLPDKAFGPPPLDVLNPYNIWLMVVFISGVSFLGYVLAKIIGARQGILLTGLIGGIVSSTAVTLSLSQRSKKDPRLVKPFSLAMLIAWTVMFARVVIVVGTLSPDLIRLVWIPFAVSALAGLLYCFYLYRRQKVLEKEQLTFSNPFELGPAIKFGLIYAGVLLISKAAQVYFGDTGVYVSSLVAGLVDADAIALSMVQLSQSPNGVDMVVASRAIVLAALSNTLFKGAFALISGSPVLRRTLSPGLVLMIVTGGIAVFFI